MTLSPPVFLFDANHRRNGIRQKEVDSAKTPLGRRHLTLTLVPLVTLGVLHLGVAEWETVSSHFLILTGRGVTKHKIKRLKKNTYPWNTTLGIYCGTSDRRECTRFLLREWGVGAFCCYCSSTFDEEPLHVV